MIYFSEDLGLSGIYMFIYIFIRLIKIIVGLKERIEWSGFRNKIWEILKFSVLVEGVNF